VGEAQRRVVLMLNHVLAQEPEATARLARQKGRVILVQWREVFFKLQATPAGLLDLAEAQAAPDLTLTVTETSPLGLAQSALRGEKPPVRIEGDVQLAAEVNWLTDHVRWDLEEDLSRVVGDVAARGITQMARTLADGVRQAVNKVASLRPGSSAS
jgi:ubiquinone biosynthesis protein UbiJ